MSDGLEIAILDEVESIGKKLDEGGGGGLPIGASLPIYTDLDLAVIDKASYVRTGNVITDVALYPEAKQGKGISLVDGGDTATLPSNGMKGAASSANTFGIVATNRTFYSGGPDWADFAYKGLYSSYIYNVSDITAQDDTCWMCYHTESYIHRFNTAGTRTKVLTVASCSGIAYDGTHLWAWIGSEKKIKQVDISTGLTGVEYDLSSFSEGFGNELNVHPDGFIIGKNKLYNTSSSKLIDLPNLTVTALSWLSNKSGNEYWGGNNKDVMSYTIGSFVGDPTLRTHTETGYDYFLRIG